jgi:hypothetical protein
MYYVWLLSVDQYVKLSSCLCSSIVIRQGPKLVPVFNLQLQSRFTIDRAQSMALAHQIQFVHYFYTHLTFGYLQTAFTFALLGPLITIGFGQNFGVSYFIMSL